jgi:ferrochelatase
MDKKTAVILSNFGGLNSSESIKYFVFNLFNNKDVIPLPQPFRFLLAKFISTKQHKKAQKIYQQIGKKLSILKTTIAQAELLEKELSYLGNYKVFVSMLYWRPFTKDVVKKVKEYNPSQIIFLPLHPQFSTTVTASLFDECYQKLKKSKISAKIKYACYYPTNVNFVHSYSHLIKQAITKTKSAGFNNFRLLFYAYGLPQKIIDMGDPYCFLVKESTDAIVKKLSEENLDYQICYQSKVGPLKWIQPSIDFEINRAAIDAKAVIVVPIDFVSDNYGTHAGLAKQKNIPFYYRVPALNVSGHYIQSLVDICKSVFSINYDCVGEELGKRICLQNLKKCSNSNYKL